MFVVDRKQVRTWLKNEEIIQQQKHSSIVKACSALWLWGGGEVAPQNIRLCWALLC